MLVSKKSVASKFISGFTIIALVLGTSFAPMFANFANAASVTSFQVILSREKAATASNQQILFTIPAGGLASGETIVLTYDNGTSIPGAWDFEDADVSYDTTPDFVCDTGDTEITLAATPSGATAGIVDTSSTVITFTNGTTAIAAGSEMCFEFGTNAESVVTGIEQITNGSAGTTFLTLTGTMGTVDSTGSAAMPIIADDQVVITATVNSTISFSISDNTIEFGTLTSGAARWADDVGGSASDVAAHTMAVGTNATGGYAISYNGATLTSGGDTIDVASLTNNEDGNPGTEEFAVGYSVSGDATVASGYDHNATPANRDWTWVASTTTNVISETGPTATETISAYYLANISALTEAGSYGTTVTYIASGTF